jgi:hypothetical protein
VLRWRHIRRIRNGFLSKYFILLLLVGKPEGMRPLRRPRSEWEDNIKIERVLSEGVDWIRLAQDRDRWRAPGSWKAGNFLIAERLSTSQEGLCSMELVGVDTEFSAGNSWHKKFPLIVYLIAFSNNKILCSVRWRPMLEPLCTFLHAAKRPARWFLSHTERAQLKYMRETFASVLNLMSDKV